MPPTSPALSDFECRPETPADQDFLLRLYASTREDLDQTGLEETQKRLLIEMQFKAQCRQYDFAFPGAEHRIVQISGEPVGRMLLHKTADDVRLVDIAILPSYRNRGIGAALIKDLQNDAAKSGCTVSLKVQKTNLARELYRRMGFQAADDDGSHLAMVWSRAD